MKASFDEYMAFSQMFRLFMLSERKKLTVLETEEYHEAYGGLQKCILGLKPCSLAASKSKPTTN